MKFGVPRDEHLTRAKQSFLIYCQAAGLKPLRLYREVLDDFIDFTGDMHVRNLSPDHVRMYIAGRPYKKTRMMKHYRVIRTFIKWLFAQKALTDRTGFPGPPRRSGKAGRVNRLRTQPRQRSLQHQVQSLQL